MAIEAAVLRRTRALSTAVRMNGVRLTGRGGVPGVLGIEYGDSYEQPVPYANIDLDTIATWMRAGLSIEIDGGFDADAPRVFTGFTVALPGEEPDLLRNKVIVEGATVTIGTPPDTTESPITAEATLVGADIRPPLPAGTFIAARVANHLVHDTTRASRIAARLITQWGRVPTQPTGGLLGQRINCAGPLYNLFRQIEMAAMDVGGLTDQNVITQVFDRVGITDRSIVTPPDGWYTLADDAEIDVGSGADQLVDILMLSGLEYHALPSGLVLLRYTDFFPAPTAAFTYTTDDPASAYIVSTSGELAVTYNPLIRKGMTGYFRIGHLHVDGNYFVKGARHVLNRREERTYLRLVGGNRLGGTVAIDPVADFTYRVVRQVINDRVYAIVTFDGSSSIALDGTITSYAWADNRVTTPEIATITEKIATVRIDPGIIPSDGTWDVALTVTASNGRTNTKTLNINIEATESAVVIAPFGVAAGAGTFVSPDGGATYNDLAETSATAVGARPPDGVNFGQYMFGFADGRLERTLDANLVSTQVLAAVGSQFNDVMWDWRNPLLVWGVTENAKIYLSNDGGATFFLFRDLRTYTWPDGTTTPNAVGDMLGAPGGGGLFFFGGDGAGRVLIAFCLDLLAASFTKITLGGELAADLPGTALLRCHRASAVFAPELMIGLQNATGGGASLQPLYYTTDIGTPANWKRATGLSGAPTDTRVLVPDAPAARTIAPAFHAMFADRHQWNIDVSSGAPACTQVSNVLPANYTPNHGLFESDVLTGIVGMQGVYLIAAEDAAGNGGIFKSTDELSTLTAIRGAGATFATPSYPVGRKPKMIAMGAAGGTIPAFGARLLIALEPKSVSDLYEAHRIGDTGWTSKLVNANLQSRGLVRALTSDLWFIVRWDSSSNFDSAVAYRSKDGGATWAVLSRQNTNDAWQDFDVDAGGRLWAVSTDGVANPNVPKIWYSDDGGDTWTLVDSETDAGFLWRIRAHPTNAKVVVAFGHTVANQLRTKTTIDRGASFTERIASRTMTAGFVEQDILLTSAGRLVLSNIQAATNSIDTSDDYGATWTQRQAFGSTVSARLVGPAGNRFGDRLFVLAINDAPSPNETTPWMSLDGGTTWTQFAALIPTISNTQTGRGGLAYDELNNALFALMDESATGPPVHGGVLMMSPVATDGSWQDITGALPDYEIDQLGMHIAVIPQ